MIRLKVDTADRWLDLNIPTGRDDAGKVTTSLVRVKVRPRTSVMEAAALAMASTKMRAEMDEAAASKDAGMPLNPDGFNVSNNAVFNGKFSQYQVDAMVQFAIVEWDGIAGDDGKLLPFSAEAAEAFAAVPALANAFSAAYTAPVALLAEEGNGSENTSSGDTADTAKLASDVTCGRADPASQGPSAPGALQP